MDSGQDLNDPLIIGLGENSETYDSSSTLNYGSVEAGFERESIQI